MCKYLSEHWTHNKTAIQVLNGFYVATTTTTDAAQLKQFKLNIKKTHTTQSEQFKFKCNQIDSKQMLKHCGRKKEKSILPNNNQWIKSEENTKI